MSKIKRTPKKADAIPVRHFHLLEKGDTFRMTSTQQATCPVLMKMEEFYTEDEEVFNCVDILTGEKTNVKESANVVMTTCYLDVHDGGA